MSTVMDPVLVAVVKKLFRDKLDELETREKDLRKRKLAALADAEELRWKRLVCHYGDFVRHVDEQR